MDAIRSNLLGSSASAFSDVTLISSDNQSIPAVRALLAARSDYFRSQFFSVYHDRDMTELQIPHSGEIIRQLVCYVYTDDCPLLHKAENAVSTRKSPKRKANEVFGEHLLPIDFVNLIELVVVGDYFGIDQLSTRAATSLGVMTRLVPSLACFVLEIAKRYPCIDVLIAEVVEEVMRVVRHSPQECFLVNDFRKGNKRQKTNRSAPVFDGGVLLLRKETLEDVLKDANLFANESYLFQVLYFWATEGEMLSTPSEDGLKGEGNKETPGKQGNASRVDRDGEEVRPAVLTCKIARQKDRTASDRWRDAKDLVKHINFEKMKPSFIRDHVETSGLLDREDILKAYQKQALKSERGRPVFDSLRGGSMWHDRQTKLEEKSETYVSRVLATPWLTEGRHEWTFCLEKDSDCTWFGVCSVRPPAEVFFADSREGWAYASRGMCTFNGKMTRKLGPVIKEGAKVRMVLNLQRGGTLSVHVDGHKPNFTAFDNMKADGQQFIPVVYLKHPAVVRLVSEKHTVW